MDFQNQEWWKKEGQVSGSWLQTSSRLGLYRFIRTRDARNDIEDHGNDEIDARMEFGESGTSFNDIDGLIAATWFNCWLLLNDDVLWETAKFLRLFNDSLFVIAWEWFVGGQFQLLTEWVEGDEEINPFPLNLPRDEREWA